MEADNLTQLSEELMQRLGSGGDLEGMMSSEIFHTNNLYMDDQDEDENEPDDVIILHMDIRLPLRSLRKIVEQKLGVDLDGYTFWLQDAQELEPHKNLVDQCVKGEGLVQINVQIQTTNQRINIVDVLKPTEAALAALAVEDALKTSANNGNMETDETSRDSIADHIKNIKPEVESPLGHSNNNKPCLNWVLDSKFKKEQTRLKIPDDPNDWTIPHVEHWFQWAVRQFELTEINRADWMVTGKDLCSLTHEKFCKLVPKDPNNIFWTHIQLLKQCKFVSVVHKVEEERMGSQSPSSPYGQPKEMKIMRKSFTKLLNPVNERNSLSGIASPGNASVVGVGSGNNGQVQLWQFLLDLLTDRDHTDVIQWVGTTGEFKLTDPERVARLWGEKKNKPAMNYEKLSRALRYYYDGDMISKVPCKRFAYKFDCDLKLLIGYDAAELSKLVNEKPFMSEATYLEHIKSDDE